MPANVSMGLLSLLRINGLMKKILAVLIMFAASLAVSYGQVTSTNAGTERRIQFADTVTYTDGKHTFKFGGDINRVDDDTSNLRSQAGSYLYSTINDFIVDYVNYQTPLNTATVCPGSARLVASGDAFVGATRPT